jgi:hypothetical protein
MATAVKRQDNPQGIIGDLLTEISERRACSKMPAHHCQAALARDLDDFQFEGTPVNEILVRDLAGGGFLAQKTHLAITIARSCIRACASGRF